MKMIRNFLHHVAEQIALALLCLALLALLATGAFGASCPLGCAPGEDVLFSATELVSDLQAANGVYTDASPRGANWSAAAAPTFTANADGTGLGAWTYDGATARPIVASFNPPVSDFTIVFVADLSASTSLTNNTPYALAGSGLAAANGWFVGQVNRQLVWRPTGNGTSFTLSGALSTGTPHLIGFAWSSVDGQVAFCVDGGAWQTFSITSTIQASSLFDATLQAGTSASVTYSPWFGNLWRVTVFRESLANASKATKWAAIQSALRAKHKTP